MPPRKTKLDNRRGAGSCLRKSYLSRSLDEVEEKPCGRLGGTIWEGGRRCKGPEVGPCSTHLRAARSPVGLPRGEGREGGWRACPPGTPLWHHFPKRVASRLRIRNFQTTPTGTPEQTMAHRLQRQLGRFCSNGENLRDIMFKKNKSNLFLITAQNTVSSRNTDRELLVWSGRWRGSSFFPFSNFI